MMRASFMTKQGKEVPCWRCTDKACKSTLGLQIDTWFNPSKLPFDKILAFIYWWAHEKTSIDFCEHEIEIDDNTVVDWNMYLREVRSLDAFLNSGLSKFLKINPNV